MVQGRKMIERNTLTQEQKFYRNWHSYLYAIFLTHSLPKSTTVDLLIMFKIASVDLSWSTYAYPQLR
jgi:hypothetical protein